MKGGSLKQVNKMNSLVGYYPETSRIIHSVMENKNSKDKQQSLYKYIDQLIRKVACSKYSRG